MKGTIEFRSPDAGFDRPVEMWLACHERVERFAGLLGRLAAHMKKAGVDDDARTTATSIRRYFNEAAPRHHEDEEVDMFPRLRERIDRIADSRVADVLDRLEAEHVEMSGLWQSLDATLAEIARGEPAPLDLPLIERFASMYRQHIDAEEQVILPALKQLLDRADWDAVGRAMAARRGQREDTAR